jgi:hypothetical protein
MLASTSFLQRFGAIGLIVIIGTGTPTDTTRQVNGYGGIFPIPPAMDDSEVVATLPDVLHRVLSLRTEKGRILYANERVSATRATEAKSSTASKARTKTPCSEIVQGRTASGAPNS